MKFSSAGIFLFTFVCALATHALTAPAGAEDLPVSAMSSSLEELPPNQVAAAERISLRFEGQPDISGEYHVSPDGTLSVPVIGRISIAEMSLAQLEQDLTRRVTEFSGRPTYVTAEIVAYRPIFVTGFVSRPGAVEWRPGLTVLQAEALVEASIGRPNRPTATVRSAAWRPCAHCARAVSSRNCCLPRWQG